MKDLIASLMIGACGLLLAACANFQARIDTGLEQTVRDRLERPETLPLEKLAHKPPETVDEGLARLQAQRESTSLAPQPESPSGAPPRPPEASRQISIADVRGAALQHNLDLEIAKIEPAIAATYVSEEEAKFDDLIFARAKYSRRDTPANIGDVVEFTTPDPASPLDGQVVKLTEIPQLTEILDMEAGVTIPLRTGARVTLNVPFDEKKMSKVPSDQYRSALRFSVSQPLLRDAGVDANVASIRIARYEQRVTDVKTRLQAIRVLAAIDKAYWALYQAWAELDVRRQQYDNASNNLAMVKKRVTEGLTAAIEVNRAEVGVTERMEGLIVAETNLKLRQRLLKLLMNDPRLKLDSPTVLSPTTQPTLVGFDFDREQLAAKALAGRLELLELELKLAADLTKIDYLQNQTLPQFMLDYSYGALGRNLDSFGGAFDNTVSGDYADWSVGLRFEMPLTNELRKSRLQRAVNERLQRLTTQQLRELTVRREIYDALDQLQQNWQRIMAARQNVIVAGINYDAELKQFREGIRTMNEVLETLTRLGDAQIREVRAVTDYQISLIDLAFATGTLLGYSHVALQEWPANAVR